jgi:Ser/Thr protein kinase RdoA (MazF antagonist)
METSSVRNFLKTLGFEDVKLLENLEGEHNHNYVFRSDEGRFVLRQSKEHLDEENRLRSERNILEFLEYQGIEFAPKSISYNAERDIHITTFVGSEDISLGELKQNELENWISNLAELHSLSYEAFKEFCQNRNYSITSPETVSQKVEEIGEKLDHARNTEKELVMGRKRAGKTGLLK